MGQRVYKYQIEIEDALHLWLPAGAVPLAVQMQHGCPCLWARVDPEAPTTLRRFHWAGTGHPLGEHAAWEYVGTVQLMNGQLVFHLFAEPVDALARLLASGGIMDAAPAAPGA